MLASKEGRELIGETYRILNEPVKQTLSQRTPDNVRAVVEQNLWQFSGFKTDLEMREAAKLMVNADGSVKPFKEFAADVKKINETYNLNYLKSEHDHVKRSAEMFEQWQKYTPDSVLQYRTMGDNRVREAHKKLQGVTLPASDPFWNSYYPPNGWRCRCSVSEVRKGKYPMSDSKKAITDGDESTKLPKQQMFRTNPGKTLNLMPEKHPYYPKGCGDCDKKTKLAYDPSDEKCKTCIIIKECYEKNFRKSEDEFIRKSRKKYNAYSNEWKKVLFNKKTGGYNVYHQDHQFAKYKGGGDAEKTVGCLLANNNKKQVEFLAENGKGKQKPDLSFDNKTWDVKYINHANEETIRKYIKDARKADCAIFYWDKNEKMQELRSSVTREEGKMKKLGRVAELPDIYYMDSKGFLKVLWKKIRD